MRRWVRLGLLVVTLVALGISGSQIRLFELELDDEQSFERVFTDLSWTLALTLADLRAAQQAYVAVGQDRLYWTDRVNRHLETVQDSLDNLRQLTTNAASIEALDSAVDTVADLARLDARAREHTNLEQPLLASDLIFTDGLELVARAATNIELARANERTTRNDTVRVVRSSQVTVLATATTVGIIAILLLIPMKGGKKSFSFAKSKLIYFG